MKVGHLHIIRGISGSGKSTLARVMLNDFQRRDVAAVWYEADHYFTTSDGQYLWDGNKIRDAHQWCMSSTQKALSNNLQVIVSNTFTTKRELAPYFEMAHALGMNPNVVCMQSNFGSVHGVPEHTLVAMQSRFDYNIIDMFKQFA